METTQNEDFLSLDKYPSFDNLQVREKEMLVDKIKELFTKGTSEKWMIQYSELNIKHKIGEGNFSLVHECTWRGLTIAVKMTKMRKIQLLKDLLNEINLWSGIRHPNLVQFLGVSYDRSDNELCLLMEKIDGSNLTQFMQRKTTSALGEKRKFHICSQLIYVFQFLHSCNPSIIYRDLKPDNIMIDHFGNVKLTDFGMSRFMPEDETFKMSGETGTVRYMAPEVYRGEIYNLKADVYSLGLVIYYIYTGVKPFNEYTISTIGTYFNSPEFIFSTNKVKNKHIRHIVNMCIHRNIEERWNIETLASEFKRIQKNISNDCCLS